MQNKSHAVMGQRGEPSDSLDDFPTPPWATRALCEWLRAHAAGPLVSVWEPSCNRGFMVRPLAEYFSRVRASDIFDYGAGFPVADFLMGFGDEDWIITNPPFRLAEEFIAHGIRQARHGVAILARTTLLEGSGRFSRLFSVLPPSDILQFTERVPMLKGRLDPKGSTATSYCWIIWTKAALRPGPTRFSWIAPCRKRLEKADDYPQGVHFPNANQCADLLDTEDGGK